MRGALISIFLLVTICSINAQNKSPQKDYLTFDYQLLVDNDVFTLDLSRDHYYSSGIYPEVRYLLDSGKNSKRIRSFRFNHRMYTAYNIVWSRLEQMDRPYAGIMSVSMANEYYFLKNNYLKTELEVGWLGPGSKIGEQQETWHDWFGMPHPNGWQYQINDAPLINLYTRYIHPFYSSYRFEISTETNLSLGTVYNNVRQEIIFRTGELRPIHQSSFVASSLGNKRKDKQNKTEEFYFFYSPGLEYVMHNGTLEGGLIGKESVFTVEAKPWVIQHRFGVMFSWPRYDLSIIRYWRTKENKEAINHTYVGIRMNQRF
ncbi:MAG: hypothetical protein CMP48_21190 [Rickettsiales bacterium]|nr:hypothetical protein [Rickettsiales bacterium]